MDLWTEFFTMGFKQLQKQGLTADSVDFIIVKYWGLFFNQFNEPVLF